MPLWFIVILALICGMLMLLETFGWTTTLSLSFKSDLKRETRFLAQYGQLACMVFVLMLIWQLDPAYRVRNVKALLAGWLTTSAIGMIIKRAIGRARPRSEHAGRFFGPSLHHANFRESFPSSHSATAVAMTVVLASEYPQATFTFWVLALVCAGLRYILDAHWPSDVFGGIALGCAMGALACKLFL